MSSCPLISEKAVEPHKQNTIIRASFPWRGVLFIQKIRKGKEKQ